MCIDNKYFIELNIKMYKRIKTTLASRFGDVSFSLMSASVSSVASIRLAIRMEWTKKTSHTKTTTTSLTAPNDKQQSYVRLIRLGTVCILY